MKSTKRFFLKLCGVAVGAAALLQAPTCNVQYPPDNTECIPNYGVCIARGKLVAALTGVIGGGSADAHSTR